VGIKRQSKRSKYLKLKSPRDIQHPCLTCFSFTTVTFYKVRKCRLTNISSIFQCPTIRHAGLGYNAITALPAVSLPTTPLQLVSLDICHNDLCDLPAAVQALQSLATLRVISLKVSSSWAIFAYVTTSSCCQRGAKSVMNHWGTCFDQADDIVLLNNG
jgi:Leucine-rich repeat (LRR) protein